MLLLVVTLGFQVLECNDLTTSALFFSLEQVECHNAATIYGYPLPLLD